MNTTAMLEMNEAPKVEISNANQISFKKRIAKSLSNFFSRLLVRPEMTMSDFERLEARKRTPYTMWRESSFHEGNWR